MVNRESSNGFIYSRFTIHHSRLTISQFGSLWCCGAWRVAQDCAAEADGPAALSSDKAEAFERVSGAASFNCPVRSPVRRVNQSALSANGPAFKLVQELNVEKVRGDV